MTMNIQLERARVLAVSRVDVNRSVAFTTASFMVGRASRHHLFTLDRSDRGVLGGAWASPSFAATTSKDKSLFVTVASSYNAAVTEFNVVIDSFPRAPHRHVFRTRSRGG